MKNKKIAGLIAAPFTPMDEKGNVNIKMIPRLAHNLKKNRIRGAFIIGSTGEGVSLTVKEKKIVMESWQKEQEEDFKIIALISSNSLREGQELASYAYKMGLYGIAILPPFYFKINSTAKLAEYCQELAGAVPSMPVYYYHIPALSGVYLPMYPFLQEAKNIPNLAGIKYTAPDLHDYRKCLTYEGGRYDMLWGMDETLISAMAMGAEGGVGSTYNYSAPLYMDMMAAFHAGDMDRARSLQSKSIEIVDVLVRHGGIPAGKYFMKHIGLDCGTFRSPVGGIEDEDLFAQDLGRIGFDRYSSANSQVV